MKNYCQFEIKGVNQERFFNKLSSKVKIHELKRLSKTQSVFKVGIFDRKKAKKNILEEGFFIINEKSSGFLFNFINLLTSYGLIAGIILGAGFLIFQSFFINKIEVLGNEKYSTIEIKEYLTKSINSKNKSKIDLKKVEHDVYNKFEDLSFVSATLVGQTLVVNIKEELIPDEMKESFSPILASESGRITSLKLIQGTPMVKVGDVVRKGRCFNKSVLFKFSRRKNANHAKSRSFCRCLVNRKCDSQQ